MIDLSQQHTPAYGNTTLVTCETEPIHVPGAIQPHGVLLVLDPADLRVVIASANTGPMLGVDVEEAVGRPLADLVGAEVAAVVDRRVAEGLLSEPLVEHLPAGRGSLGGSRVDVRLHHAGSRLVAEVEHLGSPHSVMLSYQSARGAMGRITSRTTPEALTDQLAEEIARLTGFDRVMVYRFDVDDHGEVVAERHVEGLEPLLGLHYPESDIPAQARRLYLTSWTRLIADVAYTPVPLVPMLDPATGTTPDLSHSSLRSVSAIHVEYLQNMGVRASMSVSLVVDGRLWGLVACHHYASPHRPSQDVRAAAEFLGQVASTAIGEQERVQRLERAHRSARDLGELTGRLADASTTTVDSLAGDPALLDLVEASGALVWSQGLLAEAGEVPEAAILRDLALDLLDAVPATTGQEPVELAHVSSVVDLTEEPRLRELAAGVLVVGDRDRGIVWVRPEQPHSVDWGGDPYAAKTVVQEGETARLAPRRSFEVWREEVRHRAAPWEQRHLEVADQLLGRMDAIDRKRSRDQVAVAESLQRSVVADWAGRVVPGLEVAVRYRPASTYQLGGDWWDHLELDDGRVVFVIGDTAGHGVAAVAAMTQIRAALRAYLVAGTSVASSLDQLDRFIATLLGEHVASAALVVIDRREHTLEVVVAGHPEPLLIEAGQHVVIGATARPLLGVGSGEAVSRRLDVEPGSTLLLFTDGLVERRGSDLFESLAGLRDTALSSYPGENLDQWLEALVDQLPGGGDDDTTVVAVRIA